MVLNDWSCDSLEHNI